MKSEATNSFKVNVNSVLSWHLDRMEAISYIFTHTHTHVARVFCVVQSKFMRFRKRKNHLGTGQLFAGDFMGQGPVTKKARG